MVQDWVPKKLGGDFPNICHVHHYIGGVSWWSILTIIFFLKGWKKTHQLERWRKPGNSTSGGDLITSFVTGRESLVESPPGWLSLPMYFFLGDIVFYGCFHPMGWTPWKINMEPENDGFGRWFSFSIGWFVGSMLIFRGETHHFSPPFVEYVFQRR